MARFIEATDALRVLSEHYNYRTDAENYRLALAISKVPTADVVERKKGTWKYVNYGDFGNWHCTACGKIPIIYGDENFCPNCGADMRKETEDAVH